MVPQTLEPETSGRGDWRWLGFLERYTRGRVLARKCGSDKYRDVKDCANIKFFPCKIFYINFLRLIWLTENNLLLTKYFIAK